MRDIIHSTWGKIRTAPSSAGGDKKFGTFTGVFVLTVLTILGAIMYLRLGWVVGNAGLLGSILIILLAHGITVSTGLSVSSIATNIRVGAGGAFSIISQSLGLEVGGSISVPLYLALLLAYQVTRNWHGRINLCMVVPDAEVEVRARQFLQELVMLARLPRQTTTLVFQGDFWEKLPQAPHADLTILGLQASPDLDFGTRVMAIIDASCVCARFRR